MKQSDPFVQETEHYLQQYYCNPEPQTHDPSDVWFTNASQVLVGELV